MSSISASSSRPDYSFQYLTACVEAGGTVPEEVARFLPWNLSDADHRRYSLAKVEASADTS